MLLSFVTFTFVSKFLKLKHQIKSRLNYSFLTTMLLLEYKMLLYKQNVIVFSVIIIKFMSFKLCESIRINFTLNVFLILKYVNNVYKRMLV